MKALIIATIFAAAAVGIWQRTEIESLHSTETLLLAGNQRVEAASDASVALQSESPASGPSDEEVATFAAELISVRADFSTDRWNKKRYATWTENPKVCETLSKLTSQQLRAVIESWESNGTESKKQHATGIYRFMNLAGMMNPQAALEVLYEKGEIGGYGRVDVPFTAWFRKDPAALLSWLKGQGIPTGFNRSAQIWADVATALSEPNTENVAKLVRLMDGYAVVELARKLPNQESRIAFLRSLHAANGGKSDDLRTFVRALADNVPFSQFAQVADSVPSFRPSVPEKRDYYDKMQPLCSLRFEVALASRDGTPEQRWNWLVQQAEDRPTGKALEFLVGQWCERDYSDVAQWARGLPPGEDRTEIRKAIHIFVKEDQRMRPKGDGIDRAAEWASP